MAQLAKFILPTVVVGGIALVAWVLISIKTFVIESECEVRSMHVAGQLLEEYVRKHQSWPSNWPALTEGENASILMTQFDVDCMQRSVHIDFDYDMRSELNTEAFTALSPVKGYYAYHPEEFFLLRKAIRNAVEQEGEPRLLNR